MKIGRLNIKADRWPWQAGYNWRGMADHSAPLNRSGARFGAGWKYRIGIDIGGTTVMVNLLFGMIRFSMDRKTP